jgi:hypothetical protein
MIEFFCQISQRIYKWRLYLFVLLLFSLGVGIFFLIRNDLQRNDVVLFCLTITSWCLFSLSFSLFFQRITPRPDSSASLYKRLVATIKRALSYAVGFLFCIGTIALLWLSLRSVNYLL